MPQDRSWTEINLANYRHNIAQLRNWLPAHQQIMQIVKADAYGHGAYQIAREAEQLGICFLGVANADEGKLLRYQGIKMPILILSPSLIKEIPDIIKYHLTPTISAWDFAEELNLQTEKKIKVQINIDRGMGRSGFASDEICQISAITHELNKLEISGVFSHYAASESDLDYSQNQQDIFEKILPKLNFEPEHIHIANSSAVLTTKPGSCNLVRIGLLSYGVYTDKKLENKIKLLPVMNFKTTISQIKAAHKNQSIGYNQTYIAQRELTYAILPVGYADGYDFLLSNRGKAFIKGQLVPVIGKISMDMTAIDISNLDCEVGTEVSLLGAQHPEIRAERIAASYQGSAYELLCQIGRRAKRYFHYNGKIIDSSPLMRRDFFSGDFSDNKLNDIIESAIQERMQSKQMAELLYSEVLKKYFIASDNDIHYRRNFTHTISLENCENQPDYYQVRTELRFSKKLMNDYFLVACANSEKNLEKYFQRNEVEYRWLLDEKIALNENSFQVTDVRVNGKKLQHQRQEKENCLEICCSAPELQDLLGQEVEFSISTETYYPKSSKQLAVYLIEMTKAVEISLLYPAIENKVEAIAIFSGKTKFPQIVHNRQKVTISSAGEWVFPTSGVVFIL